MAGLEKSYFGSVWPGGNSGFRVEFRKVHYLQLLSNLAQSALHDRMRIRAVRFFSSYFPAGLLPVSAVPPLRRDRTLRDKKAPKPQVLLQGRYSAPLA